jgi:glucose/arabinose dehydrogenase
MRARALVLILVIVLLGALTATAACRREPTGTPEVVGTTPPSEEPTPTPELTTTPLSALTLALEPVASGFEQPVYATGAGDGSGRLFVVEKTGRVWILRDGVRSATPFLDLSGAVSRSSEQGLLGLAFPPDFDGGGLVFVNYTRADGATVIASFTVTGDTVDPASHYVWLTIPQPFANHNGGMIAFGPDRYLYVGMGDGGGGGDPQGNGQNPGALLGKMLRIDVGQGGVYAIPGDNPFVGQAGWAPEIWALGLRNPWRFSFDRDTGDLWIGDVGQNAWEEIDFQPADSAGGENYGWSVYEATHTYPPDSPAPANADAFTMPVLEYDRTTGTSVTGGYVYRGSQQEPLWGTYFYADFSFGRVWGLQVAADGTIQTRELADIEGLVSSFAEDEEGELYLIDFGGTIYRMVAP